MAVFTCVQRVPDRLLNTSLAVAVAACSVAAAMVERHSSGRAPDAFAYAVMVIAAGALVIRQRKPVAVFSLALAAGLAYIGFDYPQAPALWPFVIAVYTVAVMKTRLESFLLTAGAMIALSIVAFAVNHAKAVGPQTLLWVAAWLLAGWLVSGGRARRAQAREEHSRRMVDAERLRIARELHDVVAHSIATISVQAGVASHVVEQQPEQAAIALQAIKKSSREALRELRGILSVLRSIDDVTPRSPEPGLDRVDALIDTVGRAGLSVRLSVCGQPRDLPRTVEAAAYRIIQESLTNTLRYAGPARATVVLTYEDSGLALEITDDGSASQSGGSESGGLGILGMRERAAAFGGELDAGPLPEGGFRVRALLPLEER